MAARPLRILALLLALPALAPAAQADVYQLPDSVERPLRAVEPAPIHERHAPVHEQVLERTQEFVDEFDPFATPVEQLRALGIYVADITNIVSSEVNECIVFVADPNVSEWLEVDLSDAPDRIRLRAPFAMAPDGHFQAGYLLVALRLSGEVACGLDLGADDVRSGFA